MPVPVDTWDNGPSGTEGAMKTTDSPEELRVNALREADKRGSAMSRSTTSASALVSSRA